MISTARDLLAAYKALPEADRVRIEAEANKVRDLSGELAVKSGRSALRAGFNLVDRDGDEAGEEAKQELLEAEREVEAELEAEIASERETAGEGSPVDRDTRAIMDELNDALTAMSVAAGPGVLDYMEDNSRTVRWANKAVSFGTKRFGKRG